MSTTIFFPIRRTGDRVVTSPLGNVSNVHERCHELAASLRRRRCHLRRVLESASVTYDANGNFAGPYRFQGRPDDLEFDLVRNLETSRTEAVGTPVATNSLDGLECRLRLPEENVEPAGLRLMLDSAGNVLTKTVTDMSVTPHTNRVQGLSL